MKVSCIRIAIAGAVLSAALSGCIVAPAPGPVGVVAYAPPAPQVEVYGVPPQPGFIWMGGAYFWEGGRYAWHAGHWAAPRPGYHWVPHAWVRAGGGWRMNEGHWARG